ncbi:MAG: ion channel [Solirubrobacteraceae bacterium]
MVFASAISLIALGTIVYSASEGWSVFDSFYFAVCTLTTSNVSDPRLVLTNEPIRVFTAFYVLIGLGVLVETARQIGTWYVKTRSEHGLVAKHAEHRHSGAVGPQSSPPTSSTRGS